MYASIYTLIMRKYNVGYASIIIYMCYSRILPTLLSLLVLMLLYLKLIKCISIIMCIIGESRREQVR